MIQPATVNQTAEIHVIFFIDKARNVAPVGMQPGGKVCNPQVGIEIRFLFTQVVLELFTADKGNFGSRILFYIFRLDDEVIVVEQIVAKNQVVDKIRQRSHPCKIAERNSGYAE